MADDFEAKIGLFGRQAAVHKPLSWSISTIFVGRSFMSLLGQVINFPASVADFLTTKGKTVVDESPIFFQSGSYGPAAWLLINN